MIGEPAPTIEWVIKTSFDNKTSKINGSIDSSKMSLKNVGSYTCSGKNSKGVSNMSLVYNVEMISNLEPEIIEFVPTSIYVVAGNDLQLNCMCHGCAPLSSSSWTYQELNNSSKILDGKLLNFFDEKMAVTERKSSYSIKLSNFKSENEGLYTCYLKNNAGDANAEVHLQVIGEW